jgi:hypothetical protein
MATAKLKSYLLTDRERSWVYGPVRAERPADAPFVTVDDSDPLELGPGEEFDVFEVVGSVKRVKIKLSGEVQS